MTNFSQLRVGPAQSPFSPTVSNATGDMPVTNNSASLKGMVLSPIYKYQITPSAAVSANLAANAVYSGAAFSQVTLAAGTSVTAVTIGGVTHYDIGSDRGIQVAGNGVSSIALLVTVSGLDGNFRPLTTTFTGPTGTATVSSPKTMQYVRGAAVGVGNTVSGYTFGTADVFGMPYNVITWGDVVALNWTDKVTSSAGWTSADTTTPATSATGPTRGKYAVPSAADATKKLTIYVAPVDDTTVSGLYGVTQV